MKKKMVTHKNGKQILTVGRYDMLGKATGLSGSSITFESHTDKELCNPDANTRLLCVIRGRDGKRNFKVDLEKRTLTPLAPFVAWPELLNTAEVLRLAQQTMDGISK